MVCSDTALSGRVLRGSGVPTPAASFDVGFGFHRSFLYLGLVYSVIVFSERGSDAAGRPAKAAGFDVGFSFHGFARFGLVIIRLAAAFTGIISVYL